MAKRTTTNVLKRKVQKTVTAAPQPATPASRTVLSELPPLEDAIARIRKFGWIVKLSGGEHFNVHEPDPVDSKSPRSYLDSARLREIAMLDEPGIRHEIENAPVRTTPVFLGNWKPLTIEGDDMTKKSTKKNSNGSTNKAGGSLPESSITDEKVLAYFEKAAKAGVKLTPAGICRFIRKSGDGLSEKRCARLLKTVDIKELRKLAPVEEKEEKTTTKAAASKSNGKSNGNGNGNGHGTKKPATRAASGKKKAGYIPKPNETTKGRATGRRASARA